MADLLESNLYSYLTQQAEYTMLAGTRLYPRKLPQEPTLPASVYRRVTTRRLHDLKGPDGLPRARFQITAWGRTPLEAANLAKVTREILDGFSGFWSDTIIQACLCVADNDVEDPSTGRSGVAQDFMIHYVEG